MSFAVLDGSAASSTRPTDFSEHTLPAPSSRCAAARTPRTAAFERRPIGRKNYACEETTVSFFADEVDHPFTFPEKRPFWWIRGNQVGGRPSCGDASPIA